MICCSLGLGSLHDATIDSFTNFSVQIIITVCLLDLGAATPKSPTVRSPTISGSPLGSAQNSDAENDPQIPGLPSLSCFLL